MKGFVLDASITLAWCFEDEATSHTNTVLRALQSTQASAPGIWALEVANGLLGAKRKKRLTSKQFEEKLEFIKELPVQLESLGKDAAFGEVLGLADAHGLTTYDACYLELAMRLAAPLATLDGTGRRQGLKQASERCGVRLFSGIDPDV